MKGIHLVGLLGVVITIFVTAYAVYVYWDLGHAPVEKLPSLNRLTIDQVVARLGEATNEANFTLDKVGDDLRRVLFNHYSPERSENRKIEVKEVTWQRFRYTITVWLHKAGDNWVVLDACRWKNHVRF